MKFYPRLPQEILLAYKGIKPKIIQKPEIQINFPKDDFFQQNEENFYYLDNPFCYISILLYKKGPLTSNEIWNEYLKHKEKGFEYDPIDSKNILKTKYVKRMLRKDHLLKAGYSKTLQKPLGYRVNPKIAFEWIHPALLLELDPQPDCDLVHRYGPMRDEYLKDLEEKDKAQEIPDEVIVESETKKNLLEDKRQT